MADLRLSKVTKRIGSVEVIHSLDLAASHGEFVVFVGPSGCGKTTLLRMIAGLDEVSEGEILIDGKSVTTLPPVERGVAMVFQNYALYPHMSVAENIGFGLTISRVPKAERKERVLRAARILQLEKLLDRRPKDLSGGQRQRVAIGRAIVKQPGIFLFDEPLSNLDAELRAQMRLEVATLHRDLGATMIYVTHDQVEAMTLADKIVIMRGGRIEQQGTPATVYNDPANRFVAGFIGAPKMNFFDATIETVEHGVAALHVAAFGPELVQIPGLRTLPAKGAKVTLGVRPEYAELSDDGFEGTIAIVEWLGHLAYVHLTLAEGNTITIDHRGRFEGAPGATVRFKLDPRFCFLFGPSGDRI
jgi:ABC-type sugar transport system ATPase subunit